MLGDPDTPDSFRSVLEMIRRNVILEARLIDDLLDLSRIRQGSLLFETELADAHQLIHDVINICRDDLKKAQLHLAIDLDARRHHVDADPIRFQQALWNLIKNAIKFTPAGGRLSIRSRNRDRDRDSTAENAPDLVIEIQDTGIGIEPDILPRIFDVLEQGGISTTRRFGGLGLGLTISRSIIEQHGGRLDARSPGAGAGATFTIELPTAAPPAPATPDESTPPIHFASRFHPARPLKILLVEDNVDTGDSLASLLSARASRANGRRHGVGIQVVRETDLDLLISDIGLPDGSGLDLLRALRSTQDFPAIALSGFGTPADIDQSRSSGFAIHLTKPVDFRRLEEAIEHLAASPVVVG